MAPPKYQDIADELRRDLGRPGDLLPTETELADRHDTTRNTVRQAFDLLEGEGLIVGGYSQRRIVRDTRRWTYNMNDLERHGDGMDGWTRSMLEQGAENPETTVEVQSVLTTAEVAARLGIPKDRPIMSRRRTHWIAGFPHMLSDSYYPRRVTDGFDDFLQPTNVSVPGGLLAASGHKQIEFEDQTSTRLPTAEEASVLRMPATIPLLVLSRTGYEKGGQPVRLEIRRMPADQVEVVHRLRNE